MTVVSIDAPRFKHTIHGPFMTRSTDMIHDFILTAFAHRTRNSRSNIFQHFMPINAGPFPFAAFSRTLQWIQNAFRIFDLIDGRGSFRTIFPAAARMITRTVSCPRAASSLA